MDKLFKKGKFWQQYEFRGEFNRLAKVMKKDIKDFLKKRKAALQSINQPLN